MLPDEGNGLIRWQSINDGEAGQRRPGPSATAGTSDLNAFSQGSFPGFVQNLARVHLVARQPEVDPANPAGLPCGGWRWLAEQVDGEGGPWPRRERPSKAAAPDEASGWQSQHASAGRIPRAGHQATLGKVCERRPHQPEPERPTTQGARSARHESALGYAMPAEFGPAAGAVLSDKKSATPISRSTCRSRGRRPNAMDLRLFA